MKSSEIISLVNEAEERFPVDTWEVNGLHVWPFVRVRLYNIILEHSLLSADDPQVTRTRVQHMRDRAIGLMRLARAMLVDSGRNASAHRQADILFLSDGVSFASVDGLWYEKFCDPIRRVVLDDGCSSLFLVPLYRCLVPRKTASCFVQPHIDLAIARSGLRARSAARPELPGYAEFEYWLSANEARFERDVLDSRWVSVQAARIHTVSAWYQRVLRRVRPRLAFVVNYYSLDGMAFTLACRSLRVPVVDLQHGLQGDNHIAYGRWTKMPRSGFELLPDWFWCWSERDAQAIQGWADRTSEAHRTIVGGNPWLEEWTSGDARLAAATDAAVRAVKERRGSHQRHVLVTLQWGLSKTETEKLIGAMRLAPPELSWWVRVHPYALDEREAIRAALKEGGITTFELDLATDLPLHGLLRHMDIHVTHSSSTVIEARFFGVPSVVTSEYGLEFFGTEATAGWVVPGLDPAGIIHAVRGLLAQETHLKRTGIPHPRMVPALRTLLQAAQTGPVNQPGVRDPAEQLTHGGKQ